MTLLGLAPYFFKCLSIDSLSEVNIEVIRQTLYKAYLEDFYHLCKRIGGPTAEGMLPILEVRVYSVVCACAFE